MMITLGRGEYKIVWKESLEFEGEVEGDGVLLRVIFLGDKKSLSSAFIPSYVRTCLFTMRGTM